MTFIAGLIVGILGRKLELAGSRGMARGAAALGISDWRYPPRISRELRNAGSATAAVTRLTTPTNREGKTFR